MKNIPKGLRNAVMAVLPFFGRFGASKDNSPESFMPPVEIEGSGPGKRRHKKTKTHLRTARSYVFDIGDAARRDAFVRWKRQPSKRILVGSKMKSLHQIAGSMRGTEQLRDDRRRRSLGLPRRDQMPNLSI